MVVVDIHLLVGRPLVRYNISVSWKVLRFLAGKLPIYFCKNRGQFRRSLIFFATLPILYVVEDSNQNDQFGRKKRQGQRQHRKCQRRYETS